MKIISIVRYVAVVVMGIIFGMSIALHVRGSIQTHTANAESPVSTDPLVSFYYKFKELIMPSKSRTSDHSHSQISGPSSKGETQHKTNAHDVSEKITSIERSHMTPNEANIVGTDAMTAGEHHSDLIHFTFLGPRSSQLLSGISENEKNIFEAISNDVLSLRKTVTKVTTAVSSKSDLTSNVSKDEAIIDRGRDKSRKIINNRLEVGGIGAVTKALPFSGDKSPPLSDSNAVSYTHPPVTLDAQSSKCPYSWRVFVYDVPPDLPSVAIGRAARRDRNLHVCQKCILEQFSLEYIFQDFFTQTPCRVRDPAHADYFYLPIIRDAEFRVALDPSNTAVKDRRASSDTEIALLELMEKNRSAKFEKLFNIQASMQQYASGVQVDGMHWWHRHGGADHIFVMPAPVTNLRHQGGMRGFFHYMSHLKPPIFLGVEYSLSFLAEYPVCAAQKNVMVPYPTTDPDLFSGKLHADPVERHSLLYYAGGMHGDCVGVRRALKQLMHNGTVLNNAFKHEERTSSDPLPIVPRYASSMKEREHGFRAAVFCPIPIGDSPSSKRMYDVMHFGCIPVILSDDMAFAFTRQAGGHLDEQAFAVRLPQSVVQYPTGTYYTRELL